jgi:paired amphipathic helix protein Sin3a
VAQIKDRFKYEPVIYREFLNILQLYKDNSLGIAAVKAKVAQLFRRHPDLLEKFSIFLPEQESMSSSSATGGACGGGRGLWPAGKGLGKGRPTVLMQQTALPEDGNDDKEDVFRPSADDGGGLLLYDLRQQIISQQGHDSYRDFLKLLSLVSAGVLTPDEFAAVLHEKMLTGNGALKASFVGLKALMGARQAEFPAISDVDLTHCTKVGVSYKKLPREVLPPLCSGRTPYWQSVLNDEWVSVSSGREDFGQMKRTQYEVAMFLCEDDRYELDMLVEGNLSTMRAIRQRLAELPESEREAHNSEDDAAEAEGEPDDDLKLERVRTLRERPPATDAAASEEELPTYFAGDILKPRHMRIIQMVYGDNWPEISALMQRAPGVTLRVLLKRLQRKDAECECLSAAACMRLSL